MPSFTNVKISGLSAPKVPGAAVVRTQSKSNFLVIILVIIVIAILVAAGWYAYTFFLSGQQASQSAQTQAAAQATTTPNQPAPNQGAVPILNLGTTTTGVAPTAPASASFTHVSFFKTPADQILKLALSSATVPTLLATTNKTASIIEIDTKDASGNAASANELLAAQNAEILNALTLASDFNPDATFFAYRDSNGFWPGYVIGLAPNQSWLTVQSSVQQIESSPAIPNLFLTENIGTPSPDGFTDSTIGSASVRVLPFFGGAIPAYFVYGWTPDHRYLILSTSQNGFAAALTRLGY